MKPFDSEHVTFAIFMSESRRFFEEYNRGWHLGDNVGMMAFDMSKPCIENWKISTCGKRSEVDAHVSNVGFTFVYCHKVFQNLDMR